MTSKKFLALLDNPAGPSEVRPSQRRLSPGAWGQGKGRGRSGCADKASDHCPTSL